MHSSLHAQSLVESEPSPEIAAAPSRSVALFPIRLSGETVFQSVLRRVEALGVYPGNPVVEDNPGAIPATEDQLQALRREAERHGVELSRLTRAISYVAAPPNLLEANYALWLADALSLLPVCPEVPGDLAERSIERHVYDLVTAANRVDVPTALAIERLRVSKGAAEQMVARVEDGLAADVNQDVFRRAVDLRVRLYLSAGADDRARLDFLALVCGEELDDDVEMWIDRAAAERLAAMVREADVRADAEPEPRLDRVASRLGEVLERAEADGVSPAMRDWLRETLEVASGVRP